MASRGYPVELLAEDASVLRRLARSASGATSNRHAPARVALAPSRAVFVMAERPSVVAKAERPSVVVKGHPVAAVSVVAASVAADPARGAEIVEQ